MKKLILDTDIGVDCDDAIAIALLLGLQKKGLCTLLGVSTCTAREGATSAVNAILNYYGEKNVPCGKMYSPFLPCDSTNNYAKKLMQKYSAPESVEESVNLLRRLLATSTEQVDLVAVGPLTVIAQLMQSTGDNYSHLCGIDLIKQKVKTLYTMSCRFNASVGEWNVLQDIQSARYVFDNCPVQTVVSPGELGDVIFTGGILCGKTDNPVWDSIVGFFEATGIKKQQSDYKRESWDPLTCYSAVFGVTEFEVSVGNVKIDEHGISHFTPNPNGKSVILNRAKNPITLGEKIDSYLI